MNEKINLNTGRGGYVPAERILDMKQQENKSPVKGQTVWIDRKPHRSSEGNRITKGTLTSIGSKYYTVKDKHSETKFDKETMHEKTNYSPMETLYFCEQDLFDARELQALETELRTTIPRVKMTLDQLRRIKMIVDEK